jgi:hypothetical protein
MQTFQQEQPLDFENLMERQRQLMKEMTSLSSIVANKSKLDNSTTATEESSSQPVSHDDASAASSSDKEEEEEWISNWQFERVPSTKKLKMTTTTTTPVVVAETSEANVVSPSPAHSPAATSSNNNNTTTTEGGVFYFERILPAATDVTVSTAASASSSNGVLQRISSSSSSSSSPNYDLDNLTVEYDNNIGGDDDDDDDDMLFDMAIDNDDLFADLESAAVVGTDDSEISLDDLMDMDVAAIDNHNNKSKNSALNVNLDNYDSQNDDMMMDDVQDNEDNEGGDDHRFYYTSPIARNFGSGPSTPPQPLKAFSYHNSPTSTIMPPPFVVGSNSSLRSATTRPALSEMRKIMNNFMNEDNNMNDTTTSPLSSLQQRPQQSQSRLPCARGMDGMYLDTLHKLHESMKRSKRTRQSLSIQTQHTQEYARNMCVSQIIQSVQNSSQQVDTCLQSVVVGMR